MFQTTRHSPHASRLAGFGKLLLAGICASLVSFSTMPTASAAGADGVYKYVKASGTLSVGGQSITVTPEMLNQFGAIQNGRITISNNRVQLNRNAAANIIKQLGTQLGVVITVKITGPTYVQLHKSGLIYTGSTTTPVVVTFSTTYQGTKISGNIKTNYIAKVSGTTLTLKVPVTGTLLGKQLKGTMTVTCKR